MDFKQLETFQKVVEKSSYSEAAKELYVSQPTISSRIRLLQEELGVTLLKNNGRSLELTFTGSVFLEYVNNILHLKEEAIKTINKTKTLTLSHLKISTTSIGTYIIPEASAAFQKSHPSTQLSFSFSNTSSAIKQLLEKKTDLVLLPTVLEDNRLRTEVVGHDKISLIASANHPLAKKQGEIDFADLKDEHFIIREEGSDTRKQFEKWCKTNHFKPRKIIEMDQSEAIKIAVSNNLGISIMSEFIIKDNSNYHDFHILNVKGMPVYRPIHVYMLSNGENKQLKQEFTRFLKEQLDGWVC